MSLQGNSIGNTNFDPISMHHGHLSSEVILFYREDVAFQDRV